MECELCNALHQEFRIVCQDELSFCVVVKWPLKPGHVMVLPKRHIASKKDLTEKEAKSLFDMIDKVVCAVEKAYKEDAIIHINTGNLRSQQHLHIHIVPSKGDLRQHMALYEGVPERQDISDAEKENMKDYIKNYLD